MINEEQVRLAIDLIKNNGLVEVRVIGSGKFDIYSGYFKDVDNLINEVKRFEKENIYFVLNEIDEACYSREQQERIQKSKNTTSDGDIIGRNFILVDIDSDRAAGVSATDEEKSRAKGVGYKVYRFLRDIGFTAPISASSGNGYHLLYPIKLANTPENTQLIKDFWACWICIFLMWTQKLTYLSLILVVLHAYMGRSVKRVKALQKDLIEYLK